MSTRATIKIKESVYLTSEDIDNGKLTELSILLYHHSDGMPDGIGADLLEFLRDRNDSVWKDKEPMWDAEAIALDLVRGDCLTSASYKEVKDVHRDMDYVPAVCVHGDCEYGYVIDCDERKLTCYEIYPDRHPEWREKDIVEIPDTWAQFGGLHLPEETDGLKKFSEATAVQKAEWMLEVAEECKVKHPDMEWDDIISRAKERLAEAKGEK